MPISCPAPLPGAARQVALLPPPLPTPPIPDPPAQSGLASGSPTEVARSRRCRLHHRTAVGLPHAVVSARARAELQVHLQRFSQPKDCLGGNVRADGVHHAPGQAADDALKLLLRH